MNWRLYFLGLIIYVVGNLSGAFIHDWGFSDGHADATEAMKPIISQAIDKETIKNEIKNDIGIGKVKKSDSLVIIMDPSNDQKPINVIANDCGDGSICIPIENLTKRQKRRLKIE